MIAYKFLKAQAVGRFSGMAWPSLPAVGEAAWVQATGPVKPCCCGIHACRVQDLPYWLDEELWEVELAGELATTSTMVVAERARLKRSVVRWNADARRDFGAFCSERARAFADRAVEARHPIAAHATQWASDAAMLHSLGNVAGVAYVAAVAARAMCEQGADRAYAEERAIQARFLASQLDLPTWDASSRA